MYANTSDISPVDRRVFTRLSASAPAGASLTFTVIFGFCFSNAEIIAFAVATEAVSLPVWNEMVVSPEAELADPPLEHAESEPSRTAAPATATSFAVVERWSILTSL